MLCSAVPVALSSSSGGGSAALCCLAQLAPRHWCFARRVMLTARRGGVSARWQWGMQSTAGLGAWRGKMCSTNITGNGFTRGGEKRGKAEGKAATRQRFVMCFVICDGWLVKAGCPWGCLLPLSCVNTTARTSLLYFTPISIGCCQLPAEESWSFGYRLPEGCCPDPGHLAPQPAFTVCHSNSQNYSGALFTAVDVMAARGQDPAVLWPGYGHRQAVSVPERFQFH